MTSGMKLNAARVSTILVLHPNFRSCLYNFIRTAAFVLGLQFYLSSLSWSRWSSCCFLGARCIVSVVGLLILPKGIKTMTWREPSLAQSGWSKSSSLKTSRCIRQEKFPRKPYNKSFIDQVVCSVRMTGYLFFFYELMHLTLLGP